MAVPTFPPDALKMADDELGGLLLGYFIAVQADDAGIPIDQIPDEFAERVRQHVLTAESRTARNAAVEKALHKAAQGDFEFAGRLLREHMNTRAVALKLIPIGINKLKQAKKFGRSGAKVKRDEGALNRQAVLDAAQDILATWTSAKPPSERRLSELTAQRTGLSASACRTHISNLRKEKKLA
jgi:hypothetical protein